MKNPVELCNNIEFMEQVRKTIEAKYPEYPEHCSSLCAYIQELQQIALGHIIQGGDPHETAFQVWALIFTLGYESALHQLATREHEE